jgi:hypothetical protein
MASVKLHLCEECINSFCGLEDANDIYNMWVHLCVSSIPRKGFMRFHFVGIKDGFCTREKRLREIELMGFIVTTEAPGLWHADTVNVFVKGLVEEEAGEVFFCANQQEHSS